MEGKLLYTLDFAQIGLKSLPRVGGQERFLNPDAAIKTTLVIAQAEAELVYRIPALAAAS